MARGSLENESKMDRLIANAWRAVWVALGATIVLVGQTMLTPKPAPELPAEVMPAPEPQRVADPMMSQVHTLMPRS